MSGLSDKQMGWMRKRKFYSCYELQMVGTNGTDITAHETATCIDEEVADVGVGTLRMTTGDPANGWIPVPHDLDPNFPVGFTILWTGLHDNTGDATASFVLLVGTEKEGAVISLPATALDTVIPLLDAYTDTTGTSVTTDWLYQVSGRGILLPATLALSYDDIDSRAMLLLKLSATFANLTTCNLIGIEMDYRIHSCTQPNENDSPLDHKGDT